MSKKTQLLIAIAALAFASTSSAGASQRDNAIVQLSVAPIAALAGDLRPASDVIPSDLGTPSAGNGEQHVAKTGLFSSIKKAAKKVGGAVKSAAKKVGGAAKTVAKKVAGAAKTVAKTVAGVAKTVAKKVASAACKIKVLHKPLSCKPTRVVL